MSQSTTDTSSPNNPEEVRKMMDRLTQLETIFNTSTDIIFLVSVEGPETFRFTSINDSFVAATGVPREMVEGKLINEIIPEPSLTSVWESYKQAVREKKSMQWEETSQYPAGLKTGIVTINPVFDENGDVTRLVGSVHDITERKQMELESKRVSYLLNERIKELTTLYRVGQILGGETKSIDETLLEIVHVLPTGWQFPEITEARIRIGEKVFATMGFKETPWSQKAEFSHYEGDKGLVEVVYTAERPDEVEGPFLKEERNLINLIAEMIRNYFTRKGAVEKLTKEKELSETIINSLPGIFYLFDYTGKYIRWNKNHETVPGYTREEMEQMHPLRFFDDDEKELINQRISRVFTDGYADAQANFMGKDGHKIPYYFNGAKLEYEGRLCLMGVGFDMTEQIKMREELQQAEIKFRTLVEKSLVGVYIVQQGKFTYVNPRFEEMFGYEPGELIGKDPMMATIAEENWKWAASLLRGKMEKEGDSLHHELPARRKDGTEIRAEFFGTVAVYEGQLTIIGTAIDITERKLAEEALQKSEANLQTIFESTDTNYVLIDTHMKLVSYNQRAVDFVKNELKSNIRFESNFVNYFPKERAELIEQRIRHVMNSGEQVSYESRYDQPDGSSHWYHVRMIPVFNPEKIILGTMIAVSDITEKKRMEALLLDQKVQEQKKMSRAILNAQEKERNKIGQELHDNVNQILVGSKMYLGLIHEEKQENQELIQKSINLLDDGINEIRSLTREQVTPQRKVNLRDLVQALVKNLNDHLQIRTEFIYEIDPVALDDDLKLNIYRVVQEGINNIIKHSEAKNARVQLRSGENGIYVSIQDDGKGFTPGANTLKGVGLNNILNRVETYNGQIAVSSSPGNGCHIELSIPYTTV